MVEVIGFGLTGACLALELQKAGHRVTVVDDGVGGSTLVAAGLVNPVAGRNFQPSPEVNEAWKVAEEFYRDLGEDLFTPLPILRLWRDEKDRAKFDKKRDLLEGWIEKVDEKGVTWRGGGWLNCPLFLERARARFLENGGEFIERSMAVGPIYCTGAAGLLRGEFADVIHRSAKGEILTMRVPGWNESRILNRNGWVIPIGEDCYRVGATYEWDELESGPTDEGRAKVCRLFETFTDREYEVLDHVAGIRPIINRSEPVVLHQAGLGWMINGLGSKGVIYAPRLAEQFVTHQYPHSRGRDAH